MEIHIGKRIANISLLNKEGNSVQLSIDGTPYNVDIVMAENGACSILHNGHSYNAELIRSQNRKNYQVNTLFTSHSIDIIDSQAKYLRMKRNTEEKQSDKIISPMPGKIIKIPIRQGDTINAGDIVMVLEAMKMQSNYKVSSDCRVVDILVNEGDTVNANQVLMKLELINGKENGKRETI